MHGGPLGERVLENRCELGNRSRRRDARFDKRQAGALRLYNQLHRGRESAGDEDAGEIVGHGQTHRGGARRSVEALEIADFALSEDEHPPRPQIVVKPGQGEAGLLDVRAGNHPIETVRAPEKLERQTECLGTAGQQRADRDAGLRGHSLIIDQTSVSTSVSSPLTRRYITLIDAVSRSRKTTTPSPAA